MRPNIARYNFVLLILLSAALLGLGWLTTNATEPMRGALLALHISLGVVASAAIIVQIVLRLVVPPTYPDEWPRWRRTTATLLELLVYLALTATIGAGLLFSAYSGTPLSVFGVALPSLEVVDQPISQILGPWWSAPFGASGAPEPMASEFFLSAHGVLARILAASILARLGIAIPGLPGRPVGAEGASKEAPASREALGLARWLRVLGWLQFWPQLVIALASAVLLQFSTSGRAFSPAVSGYGDAIYWSLYGFLLLCAAAALAFYYTRAAKSVVARKDYLSETRKTAFWFLAAGLLIGLAGTVISFIGVSLSISLLIAKTVSQPPGIAITDPNKIIRALDVFVLLVNFILLLAHFIGTGVAAWLGAAATHARHDYATQALLADGARE